MLHVRLWSGFAGLGAILLAAVTAVPGNAILSSRAAAAESLVCMTDDGYGRLRPCSAGYKAANPNWRGGETCYTDDGYGRFRPCSAGFKSAPAQAQQPQQQPQQK